MIRVIVDTRERGLFSELDKRICSTNIDREKVVFEVKPLDVGDIQIYSDDTCVFVIERKSIPDLYASFRDGRYAEQKVRFRSIESCHKAYLIEGDLYSIEGKGAYNKDYIHQRLLRLQFLHKIPVIQCADIGKSADWLLLLLRKLQEKPTEYLEKDESPVRYEQCISVAKKQNMTPQTCYYLQLKQIPSFSDTIVQKVVEAYPTLAHLMAGLKDDVTILEKLQISEKRKLGKKAVETLIKYLQI